MILSNVEIQRALDDERLRIEPRPEPARPQADAECPYNTTAVDLRLGDELSVPRPNRAFTVDLSAGSFASLYNSANYESVRITPEQPFTLAPGRFALGQTLERVELPITEGAMALAARVEGRSSFARCGLLVHFTAPTIHAGFAGHITLEFVNFSTTAILLKPGISICQLIVEEVKGLPFRNDSQFQEQTRPGGGKRRRTKR